MVTSKLPWAVGVAAIWLAAVAGVSVTASVAIDRAGRDVSGADVALRRPETPGPAVTTTIATAGSPASPANATPNPPTSSPTRPTTRTPSSTSQPRPGIPNAPSPPPQPSSGNRPTIPVRPPIPRSRTVSVTGGQVTARCTGATIALRIAQPDNGWRVEVDQSGPAEVEVNFRRGVGDARVRTDVTAVCAAGAPTFTVENKT